MEQKIEFNEEQKNALRNLKVKNEEKIIELDKILKTYQGQIENLDGDSKAFWDIMKSLEKANSHYPWGHFANYYYVNFEEPIAESFLSEFGDKNTKFNQITEDEKKDVESKFIPYERYEKVIFDTIEPIKNLIAESLAENIFIRRIIGLPEKYFELEEIKKDWGYPKEISKSEYGLKGSFLSYDAHLPLAIPYHRQKMINYDALFNTVRLIENKIKDFLSILKSINSYLPFAELMPAGKMPQTLIKVEANANNDSTSVGDSNKFESDTVVGGGEIGK